MSSLVFPCSLVDPNGTKHVVPDERALMALSKRHGLKNNNMRHLIGLFDGNTLDDGGHVKGWRVEQRLQYLQHELDHAGARLAPVVGTPRQFFERCSQRADMQFGEQRLRKLLSEAGLKNRKGEETTLKGWRRLRELPSGIASPLKSCTCCGPATTSVSLRQGHQRRHFQTAWVYASQSGSSSVRASITQVSRMPSASPLAPFQAKSRQNPMRWRRMADAS